MTFVVKKNKTLKARTKTSPNWLVIERSSGDIVCKRHIKSNALSVANMLNSNPALLEVFS